MQMNSPENVKKSGFPRENRGETVFPEEDPDRTTDAPIVAVRAVF